MAEAEYERWRQAAYDEHDEQLCKIDDRMRVHEEKLAELQRERDRLEDEFSDLACKKRAEMGLSVMRIHRAQIWLYVLLLAIAVAAIVREIS